MDINSMTGVNAYQSTSTRTDEITVKSNDTELSIKTTTTTSESSVAAVYEKSETSTTRVAKRDDATIEQMKAEADAKNAQLKSLVEKMFIKQGKTFDEATNIWEMYRKGEVQVDSATVEQAKADIADDGYWGVEQTSDRLVSFAKALAGNDSTYADKLIEAVNKGFKEATKAWGDDLPDISKKTLEATISKLEKWRDGVTDTESEE